MNQTELLALAERLVRDGGPEALTMDALAAAAGLSRATVYRLVGSQRALLAALAERGLPVAERGAVRERILSAAGPVFARLGLEGTTIDAIADAAGTGPATIYRHFGDKQGLIRAFATEHSPRRLVWDIAHEPSGDLRADLQRLITAVLGFFAQHGDLLRLLFLERTRGGALPKDLEGLMHTPDRTIHGIASLLRAYQARGELPTTVAGAPASAEQMAQALIGLLFAFGPVGAMMGLPASAEPAAVAQFVTHVFLCGLSREPPRRAPAERPSPQRRQR